MILKPSEHSNKRTTMIGKLRRTRTFLQVRHAGSIRTLHWRSAETGAWTLLPAINTLEMSRENRDSYRFSGHAVDTRVACETQIIVEFLSQTIDIHLDNAVVLDLNPPIIS